MHDFLSVALVVAFSMVCTNTFTGFYSPGDIMSSFGETSTIIWSRETIGVWEIRVRGAKGVYWTNIKCMNETKIEEILNQYQFKHIYCTDRGCWALDLAQNLPSQIIPGQSSLYNHDHHHCHLQDHRDHRDNDRTLKAWGWFRCLRLQFHSHVLPACPKNPGSVNIVSIPALIISWPTI